ncbi:epoxyqueuosine reductase [Fontimonas thermophila]|uniref:Epoxyqueuosine reductase n=1 Tax=Fontimonas thermophila TaxID=1076937 RepID=A0A1I2HLI0_9GAMM|nr:tRNA epoxyqueuosine(34) reductase QueG [Fontimonas thermophila]SFF30619.1 epoxyqueuosine reductase [Fontimonas thermophila]
MNPALDHELPARIVQWARELGFSDAGVSTRELDQDHAHLRAWLAQGRHGGMAYMARDPALRVEPERLQPGTVSVISARLPYRSAQAADPAQVLADGTRAYISRYALGRDYHRVVRARLRKLAQRIEQAIAPHGYRVLCDSAPALEKALARDARLGWIGKHTLLLHREAGSWFFLGEIYTDLPLPPPRTPAVENACGRCSACMRICPTQAIVAPYQLDARRCISYLTIEHHGPIPLELRPLIGNRIFGCDDCQLVCPWNRHAQLSAIPDFAPRHGLDAARLVDLFAWSEAEWLARTEGMALRRTGYTRWLRNLAVALGNAPTSAEVVAALRARATHPDAVVREHVHWALARHGESAAHGQ